jgi:octaprenyl-diphosphate synthase
MSDVLGGLQATAAARGLPALADHLAALADLVGSDLAWCETALRQLDELGTPTAVARSARHLLELGGKRLRPLCVALAARAGHGFGAAAAALALAVELVHSATLLHDDVVDVGATRRGAPAARVLYGNAASIFAGDWLLVEALRRVRTAAVPGALDRLLETLAQMILAESTQLDRRGLIVADRVAYFRVVEGKTASLFRWALWSGGRAGGLDELACRALERYGHHLGVAFQAVDDLLDLTGAPATLGKQLFADLAEGKMTYPVIVALERDPGLRGALERGAAPEEIAAAVVQAGGVDAGRALARAHVAEAVGCLAALPPSPARAALATVAEAAIARDR